MRPLKPTAIRPNRGSSRVVADLTQHRDSCCDGAGVAYFYCDFTRSEFQCEIGRASCRERVLAIV